MVTCYVRGCKNRSGKRIQGVTFHSIPRDERLRKLWVIAIGRPDNWNPSDHSKICSAHFAAGDFDRTGACTRLSKTAIPSNNIFRKIPIAVARKPVIKEECIVPDIRDPLQSADVYQDETDAGESIDITIVNIKQELLTADDRRDDESSEFTCLLCSQRFKDFNELKLHYDTKIVYECKSGNLVAKQFTALQFVNQNNEYEFHCKACSFVCNESSELALHGFIHLNESVSNSHICSFNRSNSTGFNLNNSRNGEAFICDLCPFVTMSLCQFSSHRLSHFYVKPLKDDKRLVFENNKPGINELLNETSKMLPYSEVIQFKCKICRYECDQLKKIKEHASLHEKSDVTLVKNVYKCSLCPYICKSLTDKQKHRLTHATVVRINKHAKYTMKRERPLLKVKKKKACPPHKVKKNPDDVVKRYKCDVCPSEYVRLNKLVSHKLVHRSDIFEDLAKTAVAKSQTLADENGSQKLDITFDNRELKMEKNSIDMPTKIVVIEQKKRRKETVHICKMCALKTTSANSLVAHYRSEHPGKNLLKCELCPYECLTRPTLNAHKVTHSNAKPFKCSKCEFASNFNKNLKKHESLHSGDKPLKCDVCPYATIDKSRLVRHKRIHWTEKPYKCELCDYRTVQRHKLKIHSVVHSDLKPWKCDLCPFTTKTSDNLKLHKIYKHSIKNECSKKKGHTKSSLSTKKSCSSEKIYFQCHLCPYKTMLRGNLIAHRVSHRTEKPFKCDVCHFKCKTLRNLRWHVKKHNNDGEYKCSLCPYASSFPARLRRHEMNHNSDKPYKCDLCNYSTVQKPRIRTHRMVHFSDKPLKCDQCSFTCKQPYSLKDHKARHTGIRPFVCEICAYSTFTKGELNKHTASKHSVKPV